jgi:16S rRNA (cytidine1402-2'-O)-methyltransferase
MRPKERCRATRSSPLPAREARPGPLARSDPSTGEQPSDRAARSKLTPGLHLVATPIGNLGDLSPRARAALAEADIVLCEDTRVTAKLLGLCGIARPLQSYHEHNAARRRPEILERLRAGATVAVVSDAGTPLVSDPGYKLVRDAIAAGIEVFAVPGPSAAIAGLIVSGLPTDRFFVAGFLPTRRSQRRRAIAELEPIPGTLIVFEAPRRVPATLADLAAELGPRPAAVGRELTKRFEEVRRGSLPELAAHFAAAGAPRGEAVIVIGPGERAGDRAGPDQLDELLAKALESQPPAAAAATVAAATGRPRREVYRRALELKGR